MQNISIEGKWLQKTASTQKMINPSYSIPINPYYQQPTQFP